MKISRRNLEWGIASPNIRWLLSKTRKKTSVIRAEREKSGWGMKQGHKGMQDWILQDLQLDNEGFGFYSGCNKNPLSGLG